MITDTVVRRWNTMQAILFKQEFVFALGKETQNTMLVEKVRTENSTCSVITILLTCLVATTVIPQRQGELTVIFIFYFIF